MVIPIMAKLKIQGGAMADEVMAFPGQMNTLPEDWGGCAGILNLFTMKSNPMKEENATNPPSCSDLFWTIYPALTRI
jgi:hypothetical protein